ncbi:hypothetical protein [Streptomyces sp. NPDC051776]|uniref:hypothetical protein n=1 Tax=Streptomyces sp. NPDC051776 TaxID=3155414 RepID=UPI00342DBC9B
MRAHKIATATMLVLAVSGWGGAGTGTAFAENGPAHGGGKAKTADKGPAYGVRGKARAEGGSAAGGALFQQVLAQSARQNNNCNNPNTEDQTISLTNSRATGRCVTADGSLTAFSRIQGGPAHAQGGASTATLIQQNTAQRGRQNNNCHNPNNSPITLDTSQVEGRCTGKDFSFSKHTFVKGGGARAEGGSSTGDTVTQQNVAQEGRQNNNCRNANGDSGLTVTEGRAEARCGNKDGSFSKHTRVKGGGARAEGGSSTASTLQQQNVAQEGRQNNSCSNPNTIDITVDPGRLEERCTQKDFSFTKHTWVKGGGARAEGGSSTVSTVEQQNVAQEGRQNNNCHSPNENADIDVDGGRLEGRCTQEDFSFTKHTRIRGGGARAEGGSSTTTLDQQNVAQEGRQNNNCNTHNSTGITVTEGRYAVWCGNKDGSFTKHTHIKGGGARAEGSTSSETQQNTAQEGRQNNNCANPNDSTIDVDAGSRLGVRCGNKDGSYSKHTWVNGGGARAEGGTSSVTQQNTAQEGRQNNNCAHPNEIAITVDDASRTAFRCGNKDFSFSKHARVKGGGAHAEGGSTTGNVRQQNTAQEGRQNNNCNNANLNADITVEDAGRLGAGCGNKDGSYSKHTRVKGGGARTEGGSTTSSVDQQNTAQEGRQNNNCNNANSDSPLTVDEGSRAAFRCGNKDFSFSKHARVKGGGARTEGGSTTSSVTEQNVAQEGRQNNNCNNANQNSDTEVHAGRLTTRCGNKDFSFSKHARVKGGGARTEGGAGAAFVEQQNVAQEGRQNNNCSNLNSGGDITVQDGGRAAFRCGNKDVSVGKHTWVKGGGARTVGGSTTGGVAQQNVAQEGRQNNNCNHLNADATLTVTGGRARAHCANKDFSFSKHAWVKGGGARTEGGSSTTADVNQQNVAQEGRQNNNCNNINANDTDIELTGGRSDVSCKTVDGSTNLHSADLGSGAHAEGGGSAGATMNQQNTAQEGRQNNNCNNINNLDITADTGSRLQGRCTAIDRSTNIATINR